MANIYPMRKIIFLLIVLVSMNKSVYGQPDKDIVWQKTLGGTGDDVGRYIYQCKDGGYLLTGISTSNDGDVTNNKGGGGDYWIVRTNSIGDIIWQKTYGGTDIDMPVKGKETLNSNFIITGYTKSSDGDVSGFKGETDVWVILLDTLGGIIWEKTLGGSDIDQAADIAMTPDSGFLVSATTFSSDGDISSNKGGYDCWVVKLDNSGNIQWETTYGGTGSDQSKDIIPTTDSGFVLAGLTFSNNMDVQGNKGQSDYWVAKMDKAGSIVWAKAFGSPGADRLNSLIPCNNGDYIAAGYTNANGGDVSNFRGVEDIWVVRISSTGGLIWAKTYGGSYNDVASSIIQTSDNNFVIAGWTISGDGDLQTGNNDGNQWIFKINGTGNIIWQKTLGGNSFDLANQTIQTQDGGYVTVGAIESSGKDVLTYRGGPSDIWLHKLHPFTDISSLNKSSNESNTIIYPSITSDYFTIRMANNTIEKDCTFNLINNIGQSVSFRQEDGLDGINILIGDLPDGTYHLTIKGDNFVESHKVLVRH